MRALDSNVLLRHLVGDDPRQSEVAEQVFDECRQRSEVLLISGLVLCETIWVLDRVYRQSKAQIIKVIEPLLDSDLVHFEHDRLVHDAFAQYRDGKADFSDYFIGEIDSAAGCRDTVTFDKALKGSPGFTIL